METLLQDLRFGARTLWKRPGMAVVAFLTLALGIGANTAIFSVVNAVLLRPLPYRDAGRLVSVWERNRPQDVHQNSINPANLADWQEQSQSFEGMAAFFDRRVNLTGVNEPVEVPIQYATPNLFGVLGVQPILGRDFIADDAKTDAPTVVILGYGLWQSRFGGDTHVVGRQISLNGRSVTVIGVMPADFQWFVRKRSGTGKPAEMWTPFAIAGDMRRRQGRFMSAVARLKPGVSLQQAQGELDTIGARLEQQYPEFNTGWGVELVPLREQFAGQIRPALYVLLGAVGFLLLIACANVANLLLARAAARQREIAIRTALGASRRRVVRQLLTESVLLALLGGVGGVLLALWGVAALVSLSPRDLLDIGSVHLNLPVLGFTLAVTLLTGVVFGLAPAFEATRTDTSESLKEGGRGASGGPRSRRLRGALVVAQTALALMLLIGAGLMSKSFARLLAVSPGFDPDNVLTMRVQVPVRKYQKDEQFINFFKQAIARIDALPGVERAGAVSFLPLGGPGAGTDFTIVGRPVPPPGQEFETDVRVTDADYFRTMRIPVLRGRTFTEQEATEERHVAVINEALARKYFPGQDPIGQRLVVDMKDDPAPTEIIGVVADVKQTSLDAEVEPAVYWPHAELVYSSMAIVIRAKTDPTGLAAAARREIQALDPDQPIADVRTMNAVLADTVARTRFSTLLLGLFAALALVLAAVGLYGVMSYTVVQRTHEIGVRIALGAQTRDVLRLVVGQGMLLALAGIALGLAGAFALTRVMARLLYGVSATDPLTFAGLALLLSGVALLACYLPAQRATKVDPLVALRYE